MTHSKLATNDSAEIVYQRIIKPKNLFVRAMNTFFMNFCKAVYNYYCPLTVIGQENVPLEPFIFCSNHSSHMDSSVLMTASGLPFEQCAMVAAEDYFFHHSRKRNLVQLLMNLIPIDREASKESILTSVKLCEAFIKKGNRNLIIYPEGTRSTTGELQVFKKGTAWIAMRLKLPIVPAYISGTYAAMPKGKIFPKPKAISVTIGKPIYPNQILQSVAKSGERPNSQSYRHLTETLELEVRKLKERAIGI